MDRNEEAVPNSDRNVMTNDDGTTSDALGITSTATRSTGLLPSLSFDQTFRQKMRLRSELSSSHGGVEMDIVLVADERRQHQ